MRGDILENARQRSNSQRIVTRNGNVMFAVLRSSQTKVTSGLSGRDIPEPSKCLC